ncbi:MAG: MFS transporter [Alphaproteobacteria bacterium]|nr:MFS transporter [Alphaproteobacteria bacterium]
MRIPSPLHWPVFVAGLGTIVVPLDAAVNVAFPDITRAFGLSIPRIQWVVIVYMLAQTSLMLVFGRLGDMIGHRRVFLAGSAWSVLAFLACAVAPSYPWLLAGRVAQGIGAGLLLSCGPALAIAGQGEAMRARLLGIYTMLYSLGFAIGPIVAGFLVAGFGWSAVFWFRAPLALLAVVASLSLEPAPAPMVRQRFDVAGAGLLIAAMSAAVLFVDRLQHLAESLIWPVLALLAAGVCFFAFCRQERRTAQPIIDVRVFAIPGFARLTLAAALVNLACFAVLLLVPFYLARVAGLPVRLAGLALACSAIGMTLASPVAGLLATRAGPYALARSGCLAMAVGLGGIAAAPGLALLLAALFLQGMGQGIFQVAIFDLVTATLPPEARGVAGSLGMLTRTVGVVVGASVLILAFQTLLRTTGGAFTPAFQGLFALAAAIPAFCILALARPARG